MSMGNYEDETMEIVSEPVELELEIIIEPKITYVAERLGTECVKGYTAIYTDDVSELFDKFEAPYELRDYIRNLCQIYNIDVKIFAGLIRIESHFGSAKDYNKKVDYRSYLVKGIKTWDLGLAQISTANEKEFEEKYFNPELVYSLGYYRPTYDITDDYVNLQVAACYLSFLYKYTGTYEKALRSYNWGIGNVLRKKAPAIVVAYSHSILNGWKFREKDV